MYKKKETVKKEKNQKRDNVWLLYQLHFRKL